jgi:hypothetical protein
VAGTPLANATRHDEHEDDHDEVVDGLARERVVRLREGVVPEPLSSYFSMLGASRRLDAATPT